MVTENGMVMMTLGEYHSLNATKNKVKEIAENDSWFSDNPDVVEVDELI